MKQFEVSQVKTVDNLSAAGANVVAVLMTAALCQCSHWAISDLAMVKPLFDHGAKLEGMKHNDRMGLYSSIHCRFLELLLKSLANVNSRSSLTYSKCSLILHSSDSWPKGSKMVKI